MIWFEDLPVGRQDRYGSIAVTREDMLDFARKFDPQPFHLNDDAAAANPIFGRLAASGWHTAAMGMRLTADFWADAGSSDAILGGAGIDELRWLTPVYAGDTLRAEAEVVEARASASKPELGVVRFRTTLYNQDDVAVMRHLSNVLIRRRPGGF